MCLFCLATMGLIFAGAASTGGLAALAVKLSRKASSGKLISHSLAVSRVLRSAAWE
jgi:hypothetical protein